MSTLVVTEQIVGVVEIGDAERVAVTVPSVTVVAVAEQGPAGSSAASFEHTQSSPASTWTVNHNLGVTRPLVQVFTVGGVGIDAAVLHTSQNQCVISFTTPTAGFARVNP